MDNNKVVEINEDTKKKTTSKKKEKAEKPKKVSIAKFDKVLKDTYTPTEVVDWHDNEILVKKTLSLQEMLEFVEDAVQLCFGDETDEYIPEVRDFAIKSNVIDKYTNLSLPQSISHQYQLIYCTDAFDSVIGHINPNQFREICISIDRRLDFSASTRVYAMEKRADALYAKFEELQNGISSLFDGVTNDQLVGLIDAIQGSNLDEKKLIDAYYEHNGKGDTENISKEQK